MPHDRDLVNSNYRLIHIRTGHRHQPSIRQQINKPTIQERDVRPRPPDLDQARGPDIRPSATQSQSADQETRSPPSQAPRTTQTRPDVQDPEQPPEACRLEGLDNVSCNRLQGGQSQCDRSSEPYQHPYPSPPLGYSESPKPPYQRPYPIQLKLSNEAIDPCQRPQPSKVKQCSKITEPCQRPYPSQPYRSPEHSEPYQYPCTPQSKPCSESIESYQRPQPSKPKPFSEANEPYQRPYPSQPYRSPIYPEPYQYPCTPQSKPCSESIESYQRPQPSKPKPCSESIESYQRPQPSKPKPCSEANKQYQCPYPSQPYRCPESSELNQRPCHSQSEPYSEFTEPYERSQPSKPKPCSEFTEPYQNPQQSQSKRFSESPEQCQRPQKIQQIRYLESSKPLQSHLPCPLKPKSQPHQDPPLVQKTRCSGYQHYQQANASHPYQNPCASQRYQSTQFSPLPPDPPQPCQRPPDIPPRQRRPTNQTGFSQAALQISQASSQPCRIQESSQACGPQQPRARLLQPNNLHAPQAADGCRLTLCPRCTALVCEIAHEDKNPSVYHYQRKSSRALEPPGNTALPHVNSGQLPDDNGPPPLPYKRHQTDPPSPEPGPQPSNLIQKGRWVTDKRDEIAAKACSWFNHPLLAKTSVRSAICLFLYCGAFLALTLFQEFNDLCQLLVVLLVCTLLFWIVFQPTPVSLRHPHDD